MIETQNTKPDSVATQPGLRFERHNDDDTSINSFAGAKMQAKPCKILEFPLSHVGLLASHDGYSTTPFVDGALALDATPIVALDWPSYLPANDDCVVVPMSARASTTLISMDEAAESWTKTARKAAPPITPRFPELADLPPFFQELARRENPAWFIGWWPLGDAKEPLSGAGRGCSEWTPPSHRATYWGIRAVHADPNIRCRAAGLGVVLGAPSKCGRHILCELNIDECRDPDTGVIDDWAIPALRAIPSYVEVSASGAGAKVFFLMLPDEAKALEMELTEISNRFGGAPRVFPLKHFPETGERPPQFTIHTENVRCTPRLIRPCSPGIAINATIAGR